MLPRAFTRKPSLVAFLVTLASSVRALLADPAPDQAHAIAERLCTIARFVEWPENRFADPNSPFVIGVAGSDAVFRAVQEIAHDRKIKNRPIVAKSIAPKDDEESRCHLLYISGESSPGADLLLKASKHASILTIGEGPAFLAHGGMIRLIGNGGFIKFQISLDAATREKLIISAQLLQMALPWKPGEPAATPRPSP